MSPPINTGSGQDSTNEGRRGHFFLAIPSYDLLLSIAFTNANRLINGKEIYQTTVRESDYQDALASLERIKAHEKLFLGDYQNGLRLHEAIKRNNITNLEQYWEDKRTSYIAKGKSYEEALRTSQTLKYDYFFYLALNKTFESMFVGDLSRLDPQKDKLYIPGHGWFGSQVTASGDSKLRDLTAWQLAEKLADSNLSKDFRDIRLTNCFGADSIDTSKVPLTKDIMQASSGAWGFSEHNQSVPLAQAVSTSLYALGFLHNEITAYHMYGELTSTQGWSQSRGGVVRGQRRDGSYGILSFRDRVHGSDARSVFRPHTEAPDGGNNIPYHIEQNLRTRIADLDRTWPHDVHGAYHSILREISSLTNASTYSTGQVDLLIELGKKIPLLPNTPSIYYPEGAQVHEIRYLSETSRYFRLGDIRKPVDILKNHLLQTGGLDYAQRLRAIGDWEGTIVPQALASRIVVLSRGEKGGVPRPPAPVDPLTAISETIQKIALMKNSVEQRNAIERLGPDIARLPEMDAKPFIVSLREIVPGDSQARSTAVDHIERLIIVHDMIRKVASIENSSAQRENIKSLGPVITELPKDYAMQAISSLKDIIPHSSQARAKALMAIETMVKERADSKGPDNESSPIRWPPPATMAESTLVSAAAPGPDSSIPGSARQDTATAEPSSPEPHVPPTLNPVAASGSPAPSTEEQDGRPRNSVPTQEAASAAPLANMSPGISAVQEPSPSLSGDQPDTPRLPLTRDGLNDLPQQALKPPADVRGAGVPESQFPPEHAGMPSPDRVDSRHYALPPFSIAAEVGAPRLPTASVGSGLSNPGGHAFPTVSAAPGVPTPGGLPLPTASAGPGVPIPGGLPLPTTSAGPGVPIPGGLPLPTASAGPGVPIPGGLPLPTASAGPGVSTPGGLPLPTASAGPGVSTPGGLPLPTASAGPGVPIQGGFPLPTVTGGPSLPTTSPGSGVPVATGQSSIPTGDPLQTARKAFDERYANLNKNSIPVRT
ncbi:hypothetical protein [Cupriavidus necator]